MGYVRRRLPTRRSRRRSHQRDNAFSLHPASVGVGPAEWAQPIALGGFIRRPPRRVGVALPMVFVGIVAVRVGMDRAVGVAMPVGVDEVGARE